MRTAVTKEEALKQVRETLQKVGASEEVRGKVVAVFVSASSPWWLAPADYIDYLVRQLVNLFSHKFDDERMSIPANMVYLMSADKGVPSILLHWRVYLSLYQPYVKGWRLETIKNESGQPIGMVAVIIDKDGNKWRWERYYDNLQLVGRWKNKELMFAKTILKEALAIMFPHLNLLPPLSTVETYDPDDIDGATVQTKAPETQQIQAVQAQGGRSSADVVLSLASVKPTQERRDKSQDAELSREVMERFRELSEIVGAEEAKSIVDGLVRDLGAARFNELSPEKKRFVITNIENVIFTERKLRTEQ